MKKIIVLSCVLIVLLVSATLVYIFRPSVNVVDDHTSTDSIVSTTEEEKEIGEKLEEAEKNVSEQIETDSNIITYTKPDYYNNLSFPYEMYEIQGPLTEPTSYTYLGVDK